MKVVGQKDNLEYKKLRTKQHFKSMNPIALTSAKHFQLQPFFLSLGEM